jgi:hypothetical protein
MSQKNWLAIGKEAFVYSQQLDGYVNALADWVECQALAKLTFGCDKVTLLSALRIDSWKPPVQDNKITHDALSEDVFVELANRATGYGDRGYPFECDYAGRQLKFRNVDPWPYVFLLALSYTNPKYKAAANLPTGGHMLEALSWVGMNRFVGQPAPELANLSACHHFGTPSLSNLPNDFCDKIDHIAGEFKEGGKYKQLKSGHRQKSGDDGVDVLLRRGFPDNRGAQLLIFGGCAGGENWSSTKHYEVDPDRWLERNFQEKFSGLRGMARCYFIPRQIDSDGWLDISKAAGMIVDRCRLALITHKSASPHLTQAKDWTEALCGKAF